MIFLQSGNYHLRIHLNNGIIAYVRKVLISLIKKVARCSHNHLKECCTHLSPYSKSQV